MFCNLKYFGSGLKIKYVDSQNFELTYLRSCLTGNALNAIDGLAVMAANYSAAIEILKSHSGRKDLIIQTHIRKLLDATPCNDASLKMSRKFYDEVDLHIRALEALGKNPSSPDLTALEVLLEIFKLKIRLSTRKRWKALILFESSKASNLETFLRFLNDGIRVEESVSMNDHKSSSNVTFVRKKSPSRSILPSVTALHAETRSFESWVMCGERHRQQGRRIFGRLQVTGENLCFSCLQIGHKGNRCLESKRCDYPFCQKIVLQKDLAESLRLKGTTERLMLLRLGESHSKYEKLRRVREICTQEEKTREDSGWKRLTRSRKLTVQVDRTENEYGKDDLRRFWDLEIISVTDDKGNEDPSVSHLMKTFEETLEYNSRRYTTETGILKYPTKSEMYSKKLREYMTEGIMERVENVNDYEGRTWYLPHHMVFQNDQTLMKGQIVFDVSAHFRRTRRIVVQADVSRMFLQIGLHKADPDVTRFLSKEPGDPLLPQTFRFRRISSRLTCSPFLALTMMQHHTKLNKDKWSKVAKEALKYVYVDDLLFSLDDRKETMEYVKELKQVMETAEFS
ncbi:hypothetical protein T10_10374 [Trichinella papuae]|uniref:Reverse transcriptase domain-containing protein n=1 Tax=Trichinella papuae TaxID=268474 RepID=A0A0V1N1I0_9BILA|nr:hypothetical protein T10_10374 [Trichinella papuae]